MRKPFVVLLALGAGVVMLVMFLAGHLQPILRLTAYALTLFFGLILVVGAVVGAVWIAFSIHWHLVGRKRAWQQLIALKAWNAESTRANFDEVKNLLKDAKCCPECWTPPSGLDWVYFETSPETWRRLMGRKGWLTLCNRCEREVEEIVTLMN